MGELINILAVGLASCILLPVILVCVLIGFSVFNNRKEKEKGADTEK